MSVSDSARKLSRVFHSVVWLMMKRLTRVVISTRPDALTDSHSACAPSVARRAHTHAATTLTSDLRARTTHETRPGTPHNVLDAAAAATRALEDRDRLEASCIRGMPQVCRARRTAVILRRARPGLPAGPRPGAPPRCMGWPAKAREPPAHTARTGSAQLELRSCHRGGMRAGGVCLW